MNRNPVIRGALAGLAAILSMAPGHSVSYEPDTALHALFQTLGDVRGLPKDYDPTIVRSGRPFHVGRGTGYKQKRREKIKAARRERT